MKRDDDERPTDVDLDPRRVAAIRDAVRRSRRGRPLTEERTLIRSASRHELRAATTERKGTST